MEGYDSDYDESCSSDESCYTDMDSAYTSHVDSGGDETANPLPTARGVVNDTIEPETKPIVKQQKRKSKISKINITLLVILTLATTWGFICNKLVSDENVYMDSQTKFYIGLAAPLANTITALVESIQVGMDVKSDRDDKRRRARRAARAENARPLSSPPATSATNAVNLSVGANSNITLQTVVQRQPNHKPSRLRNNTIERPPPSNQYKHRRHYSHGDTNPTLPPNFDDKKPKRPNRNLFDPRADTNEQTLQPDPVPKIENGMSAIERTQIANDLKTSFAVLFKNMKKSKNKKKEEEEEEDTSL